MCAASHLPSMRTHLYFSEVRFMKHPGTLHAPRCITRRLARADPGPALGQGKGPPDHAGKKGKPGHAGKKGKKGKPGTQGSLTTPARAYPLTRESPIIRARRANPTTLVGPITRGRPTPQDRSRRRPRITQAARRWARRRASEGGRPTPRPRSQGLGLQDRQGAVQAPQAHEPDRAAGRVRRAKRRPEALTGQRPMSSNHRLLSLLTSLTLATGALDRL